MLNQLYQMLDPVAFTIGPLSVRWYGIAYILGFACASFVIVRIAKRWKVSIDVDSLMTVVLGVIIGVIVGARLGYCLFYGDGYYFQHPLAIFALGEGGMSFHGGLVGALLSGLITAPMVKMPYLTLADMAVVGAPLGLFFGRCANFINGELWGAGTDAPWGVVFGGAAGMMPRHPSQLYEAALEGVLLFIVLFALSRKTPPRAQGTFLGVFLTGYGLARILVEFVRQPDAQLGYLAGDWLTMGMLLSLPLVIAGVALLIYAAKKKKPQQGQVAQEPQEEPIQKASE